MASKRKFKRDYIILEAKDMNFRYKERVLPKAFAKVEINEEKSVVSLYVENLKSMKDGYRVVAIQSDYETLDLGNIVLSDQGKGEFVLNLENNDVEIKGIALLYGKSIPLIGFKGSKIDNYEEILFTGYDDLEDDEDFEVYEEVEYIEVEDDEDLDGYEEIEYIEVEEDEDFDDDYDRYEEVDETDGIVEDYDHKEEAEYVEEEPYVRTEKKQRYIKQSQRQPQHQYKVKQGSKSRLQYDDYDEEKVDNNKSAGPLLMPRQIKKGLKVFKEVKPFAGDYIENTRWWKIEINPITLCGYTMPHLGYVNTLNYTMYSDAVTQSYKYRHYLFGVQYDEYNKRKNYIYAIPGKKDEQPDRGHTGFKKYQACDTRNDNLGYWLCFIDSRTRRILK